MNEAETRAEQIDPALKCVGMQRHLYAKPQPGVPAPST